MTSSSLPARKTKSPLYKHFWFWAWLVIFGLDLIILATAAVHAYYYPCMSTGPYGATAYACEVSDGARWVAAFTGAMGSMFFIAISNTCPFLMWAVWKLWLQPALRKQIAAEAKTIQGELSTRRDATTE